MWLLLLWLLVGWRLLAGLEALLLGWEGLRRLVWLHLHWGHALLLPGLAERRLLLLHLRRRSVRMCGLAGAVRVSVRHGWRECGDEEEEREAECAKRNSGDEC